MIEDPTEISWVELDRTHSSSTDSLELQEVLHQSLELCLFLYIATGSIFLAHSVPGSRSPLIYIHSFLLFWLALSKGRATEHPVKSTHPMRSGEFPRISQFGCHVGPYIADYDAHPSESSANSKDARFPWFILNLPCCREITHSTSMANIVYLL